MRPLHVRGRSYFRPTLTPVTLVCLPVMITPGGGWAWTGEWSEEGVSFTAVCRDLADDL
jgi:hypothetical protein